MATGNSCNNFLGVAVGTSLNLGSSTTINGAINDTSFATASATKVATSSSTKTYIDSLPKDIQIVSSTTGAVASSASTIPFDDTIPQIGEGAQYLSLSITPTSATNILVFDIVLNCGPASANVVTVALFQGATANAIACSASNIGNAQIRPVNVQYAMVAGTTSATTFTVRAGATGSTLTVNGIAAARKLGGAFISSITISERKP